MAENDKNAATGWLQLDDAEGTLTELEVLKAKENAPITPVLDAYLSHVAKTGDTAFSWELLRPLLKAKIETVVDEMMQLSPLDEIPPYPNVEMFNFSALKSFLLERLASYSRGPPFTIQRICELLTEPKKHHKRLDKFMRALEKNFLVISSVDCFGKPVVQEPCMNGVMEAKPVSMPSNSSSDEEDEEGGEGGEEKIDVDVEQNRESNPVVIVVDAAASAKPEPGMKPEPVNDIEMSEPDVDMSADVDPSAEEPAPASPPSTEVSSSSSERAKSDVDSSVDSVANGPEPSPSEPADLTAAVAAAAPPDVNGVDSTSEAATVNGIATHNGESEHSDISIDEMPSKVALVVQATLPGTVVDS